MLCSKLTATAIASILTSLASNVDGHGHLVSPRSRNYVAKEDGRWWPADGITPLPEDCSHCLNIGGTEARCGIIHYRNYDYPENALGGPLAPTIQACYAEGGIIELQVEITAHHMGHFTYKACAINPGEVASQGCFDRNKLTFVEDLSYGAPPDPRNPDRVYIPYFPYNSPSLRYRHRYRLPAGLSGDLVLLQWHYITGNSCLADDSYLTYDFPASFQPNLGLEICPSIPPDGRGIPEQFWNCAEVRISSDCSGNPPPNPAPSPNIFDPTGTGSCGGGNVGDGVCADGTCCSQYGWCGTTDAHCAGNPPTATPPTGTGTCGGGNVGDGVCADGTCCSQYGWCGTTDAHCAGN